MGSSIILASASPRRRELLDQIQVPYQVCAVSIDESPVPGESPKAHVRRLARAKAGKVRGQITGHQPILGADTVVVRDNTILGKPRDMNHAVTMLKSLSGRCHQVITGVCLDIGPDTAPLEAISISRVCFRPLEEREILAYWHSGEPVDKAGAYAIQGRGAVFIRHLAGSYSGVMGLPLYETAQLLKEAGIEIL